MQLTGQAFGQTYRDILKDELADRVRSNPSYSLRAFAKAIKVSPSMLSEVLQGKKNLSPQSAALMASRLGMSAGDNDFFCLLVQLESATHVEQKAALLEKLNALRPQSQARDLSVDVFKFIADGYHVAILALLGSKVLKQPSAEVIASRLGVSKIEVQSALDRLERLELVEKASRGRYKKTQDGNWVFRTPSPNQALRKYHKQMLEKAAESLETQTNQEKFIGSETLSFDPAQLPEVSAAIEECVQKVLRLAAQGKRDSEVYHLGFQFFRVSRPESGRHLEMKRK